MTFMRSSWGVHKQALLHLSIDFTACFVQQRQVHGVNLYPSEWLTNI